MTGRIDDFEYDPNLNWYDAKPDNIGCLFAIDADSEISPYGDYINLSAGNRNRFNSTQDLKGLVEKVVSRGIRRAIDRDENPERPNITYEYKALAFQGAYLPLEYPIQNVNDFTFIMRFNEAANHTVFTDSTALSGSNASIRLGVINRRINSHSYFIDSLSSSSLTNLIGKPRETSEINFLVISYSSLQNTFWTYTGSRTWNAEVVVDYQRSNSKLNHPFKEFVSIGSSREERKFYGHIIAMGLFDSYLSKDQVFKMLAQIDGKFLKKTDIKSNYKELIKEKPSFVKRKGTVMEDSRVSFLRKLSPRKDWNQIYTLHYVRSIKHSLTPSNLKLIDINDIVTKEDVPTVSKMFLYEKYSGVLLASTWSNALGQFSFKGLDPRLEYIIHSYDKDAQYKSIIKDYAKSV